MRQPTSAQGELGGDFHERPSREEVARAALRSLGAPSFSQPPAARGSRSFHGGHNAASGSGMVRPTDMSQSETHSRPRYATYSQSAPKQAYHQDAPASSPSPSPGYPFHASSSHYDFGEQSSSRQDRLQADSPASRMPSLSFSCSSRGSAPLVSPPEAGVPSGTPTTERSEASIERVAAALRLRPCDVRGALREEDERRYVPPATAAARIATSRATDELAHRPRPGSPKLDRETLRLVLEAMRAEDQVSSRVLSSGAAELTLLHLVC
jgi:hypothetical protein